MIDYETRIEKCKREKTTHSMINCLDKESIDNTKQVEQSYIDSLKIVGVLVAVIVIGFYLLHRWSK